MLQRPCRVIFTATLKQMELIAAQSGEAKRKSATHFRRWLGDNDKRKVNESDRDSLRSDVDGAKSGLNRVTPSANLLSFPSHTTAVHHFFVFLALVLFPLLLHCLTCCCCFVADLLAGGECFLLPPHNMNLPFISVLPVASCFDELICTFSTK